MTGRPDDALLARYLVGACSEAEKARVEEAFFADDDVFERLQQIEDDLIERHLQDRLEEPEREPFRAAYAAAPRRERVAFERAMQRLLDGAESPPRRAQVLRPPAAAAARWTPRWPAVALALAATLLVIVGGVLARQMSVLRSSLESARADNDRLRQEREADRGRIEALEGRSATLAQELARERGNAGAPAARPRATTVATFVLAPGLLRSARGPTRLAIGAGVDEARLRLDLEPGIEAERFRAELRAADDRVLWTQDGLSATRTDAGSMVLLTVPAAVLSAGEYEIVLSGASGREGFDEVARYYFDVTEG